MILIFRAYIKGSALAQKRREHHGTYTQLYSMLLNRENSSGILLYSRSYTTTTTTTTTGFDSSLTSDYLYGYWERLQRCIYDVRWKSIYPGSIYASTSFSEPYPRSIDFEVLTLAFIQLVEQYAYNIDSEYLKLTIGYTMQMPSTHDISMTLGNSIPLCDLVGNRLQKKIIYEMIEKLVRLKKNIMML